MRVKKLRDNVNNPLHYNKNGVECIAAIEASMSVEEFKGYLKGNTIKYLWRYNYKAKPLEDLLKGQWYLTKLIKAVQDEQTNTKHKRVSRKHRRKVRVKQVKANTKTKHTAKKRPRSTTARKRR